MLMLDDNHPDIEEFITVKRTAGKIEHANLSVCISDKFMKAVKDDANWDLIWQGEVKKTIRARQLWDLICTSAWASAEPGMVFMDPVFMDPALVDSVLEDSALEDSASPIKPPVRRASSPA